MAAEATHSSSSELAPTREAKSSASETDTSDSFVAVDIDELSQHLIKDRSSSTTRVVSVMKKNLSRKGSQGSSGAEREKNKTEQGEEHHHQGSGDKSPLSLRVAATDGEAASTSRASGPTAEAGRWRRVGPRRPPSPWLDPSRVVIVFATMSSMGTLILLYFTLFMGKVTSGNENGW